MKHDQMLTMMMSFSKMSMCKQSFDKESFYHESGPNHSASLLGSEAQVVYVAAPTETSLLVVTSQIDMIYHILVALTDMTFHVGTN